MRSVLLAAVAASFLSIGPAMAQPMPGSDDLLRLAGSPEAAQDQGASLSRSALKATTFKIGSTAANLALLSYAVGGVAGGVALSAFMIGSSWLIFTANDYIWDTIEPPAAKQTADQSFDAAGETWMTTKKFITYKPMIAAVKLASLYVYTGSAQIMLIFGTASILTNTAVFYANNIAWDWYDWYAATPTSTAATRP
jgi:uncharacterized membrane protein